MITFDVDMTVDYKAMECAVPPTQPVLKAYIIDKECTEFLEWKKRPAVIVCPGGGYGAISPNETDPIAMRYCGAGFHTFVLRYSVAPTGWPASCCELSKAVAYVRSIADEYNIDANKIIVCGFSAGGHLAASIGVHYDNEMIKRFSDVKNGENRPDGLVLGYPVITDNLQMTHLGTYNNFLCGKEEAREFFGLEHFVDKNTPQTFIWHTFEDDAVPLYNTLAFADALYKNNVKFEMHVFPDGCHGVSTADKAGARDGNRLVPAVVPWFDMSVTWIHNLG